MTHDNNYQPPTDVNVVKRQLDKITAVLKSQVWNKDKINVSPNSAQLSVY